MRSALAILLIGLGLAGPATAKPLRTTGNELFCLRSDDLLMFVVVESSKQFKGHDVPGCSVLPRGLRYTVLDRVPGQEKSIVKVQVVKSRRDILEGYMLGASE